MPSPLRPCGTCGQPCPDGNCPKPGHAKKGGYRPERASVRDRTYGPAWVRVRDVALRLAGHICAYCHAPAATGDHVVPHSRGGARFDLRNVVAACAPCNTGKGDRTLREWVESGLAPAPAVKLLAQRILEELPV